MTKFIQNKFCRWSIVKGMKDNSYAISLAPHKTTLNKKKRITKLYSKQIPPSPQNKITAIENYKIIQRILKILSMEF